MKLIDLHVHSTASDGTYTPTELVPEALDAGKKWDIQERQRRS